MKKSHIVLLVLVAVAVCVIVSMFGDFSTYETFASASRQQGKVYHVIGTLEKDKGMSYNPHVDPNHFYFYAKDKSGNVDRVIFNGETPTDIEKSEQIVMKGYVQNGEFHCSQIQMKCPSKYKKDMIAEGKPS
ncbi:MAG: cytochrome c maturation protein CcmE [Taibaiella sp.]|nr:cytochrome c maturation protein CcmE [Taibaiella sp.]